MLESYLPPIPKIDYLPSIIRSTELEQYTVDPKSIETISNLMTPKEVLEKSTFEKPKVIDPYSFPDFKSLIKEREEIKHLRLLPVKSDYEYARYHAEDKKALYNRVLRYLGQAPLALAPNLFPYLLPPDLKQYLIWIKDTSVSEEKVIEFITKCSEQLNLNEEKLILFERSLKTTDKLVKGTFPQIRHIHFWFKYNT